MSSSFHLSKGAWQNGFFTNQTEQETHAAATSRASCALLHSRGSRWTENQAWWLSRIFFIFSPCLFLYNPWGKGNLFHLSGILFPCTVASGGGYTLLENTRLWEMWLLRVLDFHNSSFLPLVTLATIKRS